MKQEHWGDNFTLTTPNGHAICCVIQHRPLTSSVYCGDLVPTPPLRPRRPPGGLSVTAPGAVTTGLAAPIVSISVKSIVRIDITLACEVHNINSDTDQTTKFSPIFHMWGRKGCQGDIFYLNHLNDIDPRYNSIIVLTTAVQHIILASPFIYNLRPALAQTVVTET